MSVLADVSVPRELLCLGSDQGQLRLLLVGSDVALRSGLRERLAGSRWSVREARSGAEALEKLLEENSEVLLLDPRLPDLDPHEFQEMVRSQFTGVQIVTLTAPPEGEGRGTSFGQGSSFELNAGVVKPRLYASPVPSAPLPLPQAGRDTERGWQALLGPSAGMQRVFHTARLVSRRETTVLIQGESGTGKDLVARGIHVCSAREKQPFVVINCAAIPEALLEAELFGYTKGAFTGAAQSRIGRIHAAHGGTLFLDEIGDMPYPLQSKILRFLEQGEVQRLGGTDTLKVDCRVLAATNADLKKLVKTGQFREDLYYRLAVFPIRIPSLRERMEDLEILTKSFLSRFRPGAVMSGEAMQLLQSHDWPGNVRELRNVIERATLLAEARTEIMVQDIVL